MIFCECDLYFLGNAMKENAEGTVNHVFELTEREHLNQYKKYVPSYFVNGFKYIQHLTMLSV